MSEAYEMWEIFRQKHSNHFRFNIFKANVAIIFLYENECEFFLRSGFFLSNVLEYDKITNPHHCPLSILILDRLAVWYLYTYLYVLLFDQISAINFFYFADSSDFSKQRYLKLLNSEDWCYKMFIIWRVEIINYN